MQAVFIGGPLNGKTKEVSELRPVFQWMISKEVPLDFGPPAEIELVKHEIVTYFLHRPMRGISFYALDSNLETTMVVLLETLIKQAKDIEQLTEKNEKLEGEARVNKILPKMAMQCALQIARKKILPSDN